MVVAGGGGGGASVGGGGGAGGFREKKSGLILVTPQDPLVTCDRFNSSQQSYPILQ